MHKAITTTALAVVASVPVHAYAQTGNTTELARILVTPNRAALTADETLASVSVITREDIEEQNPRDVVQLLENLPGAHIVRNGGPGQTANFYLRGTEADQTLILVDGMRFSAASNGAAALQHIPVDQIERIEVVRGPRASLYGADTIGGVIQIFTRASAPYASAGLGSRNAKRISAGFGEDSADWAFGGGASFFRTDGYDTSEFAEPDEDGYDEKSARLNGTWRPTETIGFDFSALRSFGTVQYDEGETDFVNQSVAVRSNLAISKKNELEIQIGQSRDRRDTKSANPAFDRTIRNQLSIEKALYEELAVTSFGIDYYIDNVDAEIELENSSRYNYGVFGQRQWFLGDWDIQIALRYDDNEAYGTHTTGSMAIGRKLTENSRFYLSHGTAFKAPSFNDLYDPDITIFGTTYVSNPDLKAEESRSSEVGLNWGNENIDITGSAFYTRVDNLITNVTRKSVSRPENIDNAKIRGVEAGASIAIGGWDLDASVTLQEPKDTDDGSILPKRAEHIASAAAATEIASWKVQGDFRYVGETGGGDFSSAPSYNVISVSAERELLAGWSLRFDLDNALNRHYETTPDYPAPGRTIFLGVHWEPEKR